MKTIYYRVTLHEPTILTQIEGEPNSAVSYDFIPGAVLRGIVIGKYQRGELNLADETVKRLFFSDKTRFLNAYPVIQNKRSLPVPISWRKAKYGDANLIYDEAISQKQTNDKLSPVTGFAITNNGTTYTYRPQRVLNVHTQRARKHADEQLVYRYDALAPHQTFEGMIYCQDGDETGFISLLQDYPNAHIGGARSAGYGKVHIQVADNADDEWIPEVGLQSKDKTKTIITLLSDVILRDEKGQYSPTLLAFMGAISLDKSHIDPTHCVIQTTLIGGFNRKWGLPLPQTPALKRGSVIVLNNVTINQEQFNHLLINGIGERRNEGFGQIAVNWQQKDTLQIGKSDTSQTVTQQIHLDNDGLAMLDKLENRIKKVGS